MIHGAREGRVPRRVQSLAQRKGELAWAASADDEARARVFAYLGQLDAQLLAEADDAGRGEQRMRRCLRDAVCGSPGLYEPARVRTLFEERDAVALPVERVGGEQARDARAHHRHFALRPVDCADHDCSFGGSQKSEVRSQN
jgi:hypothetical protein